MGDSIQRVPYFPLQKNVDKCIYYSILTQKIANILHNICKFEGSRFFYRKNHTFLCLSDGQGFIDGLDYETVKQY